MKMHLSCLICGSTNLKNLEGYEKAYLCQCEKCSFVFSKCVPTSQELEQYYYNYSINNSYSLPLVLCDYLLDKPLSTLGYSDIIKLYTRDQKYLKWFKDE